MSDISVFHRLGAIIYQTSQDLSLVINSFGVNLCVSTELFNNQFFHYAGTIKGRFIGRNLEIDNTQYSIQVHRPYTDNATRKVRNQIQAQDSFPFHQIASVCYSLFQNELTEIQEIIVDFALSPTEFDRYFKYDPNNNKSRYVEKDTVIENTYVAIQVVRQMEVNPSMILRTPPQ